MLVHGQLALTAAIATAAVTTTFSASALAAATSHGVCIDGRSSELLRPTEHGRLFAHVQQLRQSVRYGVCVGHVRGMYGGDQYRGRKHGHLGLSRPFRWQNHLQWRRTQLWSASRLLLLWHMGRLHEWRHRERMRVRELLHQALAAAYTTPLATAALTSALATAALTASCSTALAASALATALGAATIPPTLAAPALAAAYDARQLVDTDQLRQSWRRHLPKDSGCGQRV